MKSVTGLADQKGRSSPTRNVYGGTLTRVLDAQDMLQFVRISFLKAVSSALCLPFSSFLFCFLESRENPSSRAAEKKTFNSIKTQA